ncbi:MAG: LD-carboxypeptidase [Proteobacteria bacterium]|nr:LD-carboxypeptidase [Pseudomonadota bacterium]
MPLVKPPRLRKGDVIGLISPASTPSSSEKIEKGVHYLEGLGYRTTVAPHALSVHGYLAGTDEERAADFNSMVNDTKVKAIFALRGGYGTPRILRRLDYLALKRSPKIIVGYSDLTSLQLAVLRKCSLITFSGPMVAVEMWNTIDPYTEEQFWRLVTSSDAPGLLAFPTGHTPTAVQRGSATGRLIGGNLALLVASMGSPFLPALKGNLLFAEDVDEAPHRVDRMFMQLKNAGILSSIAGLVLGLFTECVPSDPSVPHFTIDEVLAELVHHTDVPILGNVPYGHVPRKLTLPVGVRARMDVEKLRLEILEGAVS